MDDNRPQAARGDLPAVSRPQVERRKHPRIDCIAWQGPIPAPGSKQANTPHRPFWHRLLVRLRPGTAPASPLPYGARIVAARDRRLPELADRLEAILTELDQLEAWREASAVCAAIERLRARLAESGPA